VQQNRDAHDQGVGIRVHRAQPLGVGERDGQMDVVRPRARLVHDRAPERIEIGCRGRVGLNRRRVGATGARDLDDGGGRVR
jgi:hypothetical protein